MTKLKTIEMPTWLMLQEASGILNRISESVQGACGMTRGPIEICFIPYRRIPGSTDCHML